jgi:hypothetical protein
MNMHSALETEVAHVEPVTTPWAPHEMIGFGFGDAIRIGAGTAQDHKSSLMPLKNG